MYALGLLDDDKEWNDCLVWTNGKELRHIFVRSNYKLLSKDITSLQRKKLGLKNLKLTEQQIEAYTLFEIESILLKMGKSLRDIDGIALPDSSLIKDLGNRLVNEELDYDYEYLKMQHEKSFVTLNDC